MNPLHYNRMVNVGTERWNSLVETGPTAFIIGGLGLLGLSVVGALDTADLVSSPAWLHAILGLGGVLVVFIGLLGFYPVVADVAPRLSLGGVLTSALGGAAITVGVVGSAVIALTTQQTFGAGPSWGPPLLALAFILALLSFLAYGIASLRTSSPSRIIGLLLLVPVVVFLGQALLLLSKILTDTVLASAQLALAAIAAIALVAVGYRLRTDTAETEQPESSPETA